MGSKMTYLITVKMIVIKEMGVFRQLEMYLIFPFFHQDKQRYIQIIQVSSYSSLSAYIFLCKTYFSFCLNDF